MRMKNTPFQIIISSHKYMFRKLYGIGFKKQYGEDTKLKKNFNKCVALAIMPFEKIDLVFEELIIRQSRNLLIKYSNFQKFLLYVIDTWVGDESKPLFDRKLWNHWTDLLTRTNNNNKTYKKIR